MSDTKFNFAFQESPEARLQRHYQDFDQFLRRTRKEFDLLWTTPLRETATIKDFQILRTLGSGAFGRVCAVRNIQTDKLYAMKVLDKKHIIKTKQVDHVHSEVRILYCVKFPFLVNMEFYFKDNCYLFLLMPFVNGGEMFMHLRKLKKFDENLSKFYAAQVIMGLEFLHFHGLIYRDLKPENILIEADGYLKITDFGFCKKIDDGRTWTLCGTPEYLAPEIIMNQGYNRSVDWWSCGILIYEMTAGYPPFYSKEPMKLYDKIAVGRFSYPPHYTKPLQNLLSNMIVVDRSKRYGMLKNGVRDIKGHEWFKTVDFEMVFSRRIKPTYKPKLAGTDDTSYFEEVDEEPLRSSPVEEYPNEFSEIRIIKVKSKTKFR